MSFTFNSTFTVIIKQSGLPEVLVCRESSSSEDLSISNVIKTSSKLTSQYMPLSGLSQFPFNSTSKIAPRMHQNSPFSAQKSRNFLGRGLRRLDLAPSAPLFLPPPPAKNSGGTHANLIWDILPDAHNAQTDVFIPRFLCSRPRPMWTTVQRNALRSTLP